ncbi:hypothetical protein ACP0HM_18650 [Escherichia coli]
MTSQKDRPTQHEMRLDGSLLDDGRLSYSPEQSLMTITTITVA